MQSERSEPIAQDSSQQSLGHEYCDEQPAKNEPDDHLEKQAIPVMHDPLDMELKGNHQPNVMHHPTRTKSFITPVFLLFWILNRRQTIEKG